MLFFDSHPRRQRPETRETARQYYAALEAVCDPKALSAMISERDEVRLFPFTCRELAFRGCLEYCCAVFLYVSGFKAGLSPLRAWCCAAILLLLCLVVVTTKVSLAF